MGGSALQRTIPKTLVLCRAMFQDQQCVGSRELSKKAIKHTNFAKHIQMTEIRQVKSTRGWWIRIKPPGTIFQCQVQSPICFMEIKPINKYAFPKCGGALITKEIKKSDLFLKIIR